VPASDPCPICNKRRPQRFCPAKGEKICAVCCGTEREVTLDCPSDCSYLITAHRWEEEHRSAPAESDAPFPDVSFHADLIEDQRPLLSFFVRALLAAADEHRELVDSNVLAALMALAETYRTLGAGLYYERPPAAPLAQALYGTLLKFLEEWKKPESRGGAPASKDTDVFKLLVFLARVGRSRSNGRPNTRGYLQFLREQFPRPAATQPAETSRIIMP
jgi:hypothetical protein